MIKNILKKEKNQEIKSKILLKRHPELYKHVYSKKKYGNAIKGFLAGILILIILYYNKEHYKFSSETSVLEIVQRKKDIFSLIYYEKGCKGNYETDLNNLDTGFINLRHDISSVFFDGRNYMLDFAGIFDVLVVNDKNKIENIEKSDFIIYNCEYDSLFLCKLDEISNPYMIFLNKKFYTARKRNYIICSGQLKKDKLIFAENDMMIIVKSKPFGIKFLKYKKKR